MSETTTTSDTDTVTLVIHKYQVDMLAKNGATLVDQGGNSYSINSLMLSGRMSLDCGIYKPKSNGDSNIKYLIQPYLSSSYDKKDIPLLNILASPMSSREREKGYYTNDPYKINENAGMGGSSKWEMAPQVTIIDVTSKTQDGNLTDSGSKILTGGTHGRRCSDYYVVLNEVLDMTKLVNPNDVSLSSVDFSFLVNPNRYKKDT